MQNEPDRIIWVVDEIPDDLDNARTVLQDNLKERPDIQVKALQPKPRKEDYLALVSDPHTAALILDHRLQTRGGVDHTGIELAVFLRNVAPNLPIYILTGYVTKNGEPNDEFNDTDWSVEDILDKEILSKKSEMHKTIARMIRRIDGHMAIRDEREKRFQELLVKSLDAELDPQERSELDRISFERLGALALSDQIQQHQLEAALDKLEKQLAFLDEQAQTDEEA